MNLDHHLPQTLHSFIEHSDTGTWMDSATAVALSAFFPWLSIFLASHVETVKLAPPPASIPQT